MECVTVGTTKRGKWTYQTVVIYKSGARSDGSAVWLKSDVLHTAASKAKAERLAKEEAANRGVAYLPHVRHYDPAPAVLRRFDVDSMTVKGL